MENTVTRKYVLREAQITYKKIGTVDQYPKITSSRDSEQVLRSIWGEDIDRRESAYAIYLNNANKVLAVDVLSKGGSSGTTIDPILLFQTALLCGAAGIILSHNHPSGTLAASVADINLTKQVKEGAKLLQMQLLDHMILIPEKGYFSFADEGML